MARRKESPLLQAAKGNPGRRAKKVNAEIAAAAAEAEAQPVVAENSFPVPTLFAENADWWARAIEVWDLQADVMRSSGRRRPGYRAALTRFCIWTQLYEAAAKALSVDCPDGKLTVEWEMGHGAKKVVPHPSLDMMKDAESTLRLLEVQFGFTPRGDSDLTRVETFNAAQGKLPFAPPQQPTKQTDTGRAIDPANLMNATNSKPPKTVN